MAAVGRIASTRLIHVAALARLGASQNAPTETVWLVQM
jgi:hypothetical protein